VAIRGIAAGGAGVGTLPDGRVVFVHRTAPGDRVQLRVTEGKERWARGLLEAVLAPGPDRVSPPCPLYDRCGGCTLQHLSAEARLRAKGALVGDALRRIGKLEVEDPVVRPAPSESHYRNRVTFTLLRHPGGRVTAGFHALERPGRIVDVDDRCLLPEPALGEVWAGLRRWWGSGAERLPAGERLRLTLRAVDTGAVLTVEGADGEDGDPEGLLESVPGLRAVWRAPGGGRTPVLLAGEADTRMTWEGIPIPMAASAFVQVNRAAATPLLEATLALAGPVEGLRVVDAYCGVGVVGRRLAAQGATVTGIEMDPEAARAARGEVGGEVELAGPGPVPSPPGHWTVVEARVEDALPELLPADLVLLNPPRTGLHPSIPEGLREARVPHIVYTSCDPATLARDLARLGPAYRVESLQAFDLFPMTAHVETLVSLRRVRG
jgi:23S rRNA (uracil1939-C5)-methyltransferase